MTLRAVIFDRDGVLTRFDFASLMRMLEGVPGASFASLWQLWQAHVDGAPPPRASTAGTESEYVAAFWRKVAAAWRLDAALEQRLNRFDTTSAIVAFDDAAPALARARARGLRVAVLSNFPFLGLDASLRATGLRDLVDVTFAAGVASIPKPHPQAYLRTLDALDVRADECALVDDEAPCVEGARALGIRAYRLDRGRSSSDETHVVSDLDSFLSAIEA